VSISVLSLVFRAYLSDQTVEQLASSLKKGGIKDISSFFPANKRDPQSVADILKSEGLPQVSEWYIKRQQTTLKESVISNLKEMKAQGESVDDVGLSRKL
jgi:basic membrane lipoprotein Med (substrate-binding protein (PBP1-ABC) superfamily)